MSLELTNLLPRERRNAQRRSYFMRLGVVSCLLLALLVFANTVLLVPSYIYLVKQVEQQKTDLAQLDARLESAEEREVSTRLSRLEKNTQHLARLETSPAASGALRAILQIPRPGISLTGFTYTAPKGNERAKMTIAGIAQTRDALRRYDAALSALPYVESADLPISAYAAENAIPFTVALTGSLRP
jgi:Tfp pilus assembly protein PilN